MKKLTLTLLAAVLTGVLIVSSCHKEPPLKTPTPNLGQTFSYNTSAYQNVTMNGNNSPMNNQLTDAGAQLGRILFYDPRLSINNTIACASCHKQQYAFADNRAVSTGFEGQKGSRNAPAIINAANKSVFFWDARVSSLETQTGMPIQNHLEMGLEQTDVLAQKLAQVNYYPGLFFNAFGTSVITPSLISMALAQFVRSIASSQSPFDNVINNNIPLTGDALLGQTLFFGKYQCAHCHTGSNLGGAPMMFAYGGGIDSGGGGATILDVEPNTSNIGLDVVYTDQGTEAITGVKVQNGYFVIPSLRNVALTAPYMHDGRFQTLSDVIDHYSSGILAHPDLDPILLQPNFAAGVVTTAKGSPVKMNISAQEKQQLIAFLNALTDPTITTDQKFSNPF